MTVAEKQLSQSDGTLGGLLRLFVPILSIAFCNVLFPIVEKLFLVRLSIEAMGAGVNAIYASQIFLAPCVTIAMMCQVYVGRWLGERNERAIGPGVWQFIWFSLIAMLVIIPCGLIYGKLYFRGTEFEGIVLPYYSFLLSISFFYILGAALSSFYLGLGKTRLVLWATFGAQILRVICCYFSSLAGKT